MNAITRLGSHLFFSTLPAPVVCSLVSATPSLSSSRSAVHWYSPDPVRAIWDITPTHHIHIITSISAALPSVTTNSFGVLPKPHQPGKHRISHAQMGAHGIDPEVHASVDQAVHTLMALGPRAELAKFDIKSAYLLISVHPDDRPLLGMRWRDKLYIDVAPLWTEVSPQDFNAVADAISGSFGAKGLSSQCTIWTILSCLGRHQQPNVRTSLRQPHSSP